MGLAATGSQTVATDGELFVPDERFSTPDRLAARIAELTAQGLVRAAAASAARS